MNLFRCGNESDQVLLVGVVSGNGGLHGVLLFDGARLTRLDSVATAGVETVANRLVRLFGSDVEPDSSGELVIYDASGVRDYMRIPRLSDAHDLTWDGEHLLCIATGNNTLMRVSLAGEVVSCWHAPGENDAWHLNGVHHHAGTTYVSAFGMYARHREWDKKQFAHSGIIYNVNLQRVEISGLDSPHNPMLREEGWLVCNSGSAELLNFDSATQRLRRRLQLSAWTRGLTCSDDYIFVGESANRKQIKPGASAHLCIVDRKQWRVLDRFAVPGTEITFLALVPKRFVRALWRGFPSVLSTATDTLPREAGAEPLRALNATWPLPTSALKVHISAGVPKIVLASNRFSIPVTIKNLGHTALRSGPPCPVHVACCWYKLAWDRREAAGESVRTQLPGEVPPGGSAVLEVVAVSRHDPGLYRVMITVVQEYATRFDEASPTNRCSGVVRIVSEGDKTAPRRLQLWALTACSTMAENARHHKRAMQVRLVRVYMRLYSYSRRLRRSTEHTRRNMRHFL
jgi:hypothetical protein